METMNIDFADFCVFFAAFIVSDFFPGHNASN